MEPIFKAPEKEHVFGGDKNLQDIDKYLRPILEKLGFEIVAVKETQTKESEVVGNAQWLFYKGHPAVRIKCQMAVIDYVEQVQGRVRYDMPATIVKSTREEDRIAYTLEKLGGEDMYVLLYVKTGWFVFFKYADIPSKYWHMSYRHKGKKLNRMYVTPEYLNGTLRYINMLKDTLTETFLKHVKNEINKR